MKRYALGLTALACCGLLSACQDLTISKGTDNVVTGHLKSFGRKSSVEEITVDTNGVWRVRGYNSDEVTLPLATFQMLQTMAVKAATSGVAP